MIGYPKKKNRDFLFSGQIPVRGMRFPISDDPQPPSIHESSLSSSDREVTSIPGSYMVNGGQSYKELLSLSYM
jgi:hypothetical protein